MYTLQIKLIIICTFNFLFTVMAGLCKLCFISILLLLRFPDFNTCLNAASPPSLQPVYAPVPTPTPSSLPTIVPLQSPPPPTNINIPPPTTQGSSSSSSRGLNGGQKAGIAIGVMSAAGALFLGGLVYKKRRSNIRRAKFGVAARRPVL